ncbi:unnamed protein product [Closterium sp. NIES-53]
MLLVHAIPSRLPTFPFPVCPPSISRLSTFPFPVCPPSHFLSAHLPISRLPTFSFPAPASIFVKPCLSYPVGPSFPLIREDWTADEEMLLLEALEMYGMGNWGEIAEHVGSKSKAQCHDHYLYDYLLSPTGPLPDLTRLRTQADTEAAKMAMEEQEAAETAARAQEAVLFNVPVVKPEPGTKTDDAATPITSGYNTKRNEFDPEYDNEAEAPLAELEFKDSDSSVDRQLKIKMLHIYYSRGPALAELEFKESDSSVDRQFKIKMLHIYYSRFEEWSRSKPFILECDLLEPREKSVNISTIFLSHLCTDYPASTSPLPPLIPSSRSCSRLEELSRRKAFVLERDPHETREELSLTQLYSTTNPSRSSPLPSPLQAGRAVPAQGLRPGTEKMQLKREQAEREEERTRKEAAEAHLFTVIKVLRDKNLKKQIGRDHIFDLVDHKRVKGFRLPNQTRFADLQSRVEREVSVPVAGQRFWLWARRQNHTYRPNRLLNAVEEAMTVRRGSPFLPDPSALRFPSRPLFPHPQPPFFPFLPPPDSPPL